MGQTFKGLAIGAIRVTLLVLLVTMLGAIAKDRMSCKKDSLGANNLALKPHQLSERFPARQEMQLLLFKLQREIDRLPEIVKITPVYGDQRSVLEKQQIDSLIEVWSANNPTITPFLGSRQIIDDFLIYPSKTKGRVCIIQSYFVNERENGVNLAIGTVENGRMLTDAKQILVVEKNYIGVAVVKQGKPNISLLPPPKPLPRLSEFSYLQSSRIQEWFRKSGCIDE